MGGNGPHSGARNSSFALATLPPDRFAGMSSSDTVTATSTPLNVTAATLIITLDVTTPGGAVTVIVDDGNAALESTALTQSGTDVAVHFPEAPSGLAPLIGKHAPITVKVTNAVVYTVGFK